MSEDKLRLEAERGAQARAVLDNPAFAGAWDAMRAELMAMWLRSGAAQVEDRERAWLSVKLLDRLRSEFDKVMKDGRIAADELIRIEEQRRGKKS